MRHHSRNVPITQASPELMRYKAKREQIESTAVGKIRVAKKCAPPLYYQMYRIRNNFEIFHRG